MTTLSEHLKDINLANLQIWKKQSFYIFAESSSRIGFIKLGVNGNGYNQVKVNEDIILSTKDVSLALNKYITLLAAND